MKPTSLILGSIVFVTRIASAAGDGESGVSDSLSSFLLSFLPILLIAVFIYIFLRRQRNSPLAKLQQEYLQKQMQHTERVEELLERIASSLEKIGNNVG